MRYSLENIERADRFLSDAMDATERALFEKALEGSEELQQLVKMQGIMIQAIKRKALKAEIINIRKSGGSGLTNWLLGGFVGIALLLAGVFLFKSFTSVSTGIRNNAEVPALASQSMVDSISQAVNVSDSSSIIQKSASAIHGLKTWVAPDVQVFQVLPSAGATIEGKNGTLVIVPSNAFVDESNKVITEMVQFELVEALRLEDMVLYNLTTTADGKALETGGMLHFYFSCNGKEVRVSPAKPLYVEVPTEKVKKGMMVFEGKPDGTKMNWKNPKPLKKFLANISFDLLDFLPTGFEDSVRALMPYKGHMSADKELVDSLYYSLLLKKESPPVGASVDTAMNDTYEGESAVTRADTVKITRVSKTVEKSYAICRGIDPLSVKTIKTEPYAKTFIATKEFAERIIELHRLQQGEDLLKLYINNLSGNLSKADSAVAMKLSNKNRKIFEAFAAQGLTNVKDATIYQERLNAYYNRKYKEQKVSRDRLQKEMASKNEAELAKLVGEYKNYLKNSKKINGNELRAIVGQMPAANSATNSVYAFQWAAPGWVNIDGYLHLLSKGSEEVEMKISNSQGTTEVYQWLNTIQNLTPLVQNKGVSRALFPKRDSEYAKEMQNTFCFAISKEKDEYRWFDFRYNPYEIRSVDVVLEPMSIADIRSRLGMYDSKAGKALEDRLKYLEEQAIKLLQEKKKQEEFLKRISEKRAVIVKDNQVVEKLRKVAFQCDDEPEFRSQIWFH